MRAMPARLDPMRQAVINLQGGINESVNTLELKPGELLYCLNYTELDGPYGGYASALGYEVFDGTELSSAVDAPRSVNAEGVETFDDTAREARRAAIEAIPGSGQAKGVWVYDGDTYGVRDAADGLSAALYQATAAGWSAIAGTSLNPGGFCRFANARFSLYPSSSSTVNTMLMFMVDGVSQPISWDGTTLRTIDHTSLPSNAAFSPAPVYPSFVGAFNNRLFLVYNDQLFFSAIGDPDDWDGVNGAGQIPLGDEVTNILLAPGNVLVIIMRNSVKMLYDVEGSADVDFSFQLKEFSTTAGGLADTAVRMFGDIFLADDRGPTTLKASEQFGDFANRALTVKTQRTYLRKKTLVTAAVANRSMNQYRLFFSDGTAIYYTLQNGRTKGAGFVAWPDAVKHVVNGEDSNGVESIFFTTDDTDGYVYKMDSGTSFNGEEIRTAFITSYYHYGSPRSWKHFVSLAFQISASIGTTFYVKTDYDYSDATLPRNPYRTMAAVGEGGVWGEGVWGTFVWGAGFLNTPLVYVYGYGSSMAINLRTQSKFHAQHIIHNYIADYTVHERRL